MLEDVYMRKMMRRHWNEKLNEFQNYAEALDE